MKRMTAAVLAALTLLLTACAANGAPSDNSGTPADSGDPVDPVQEEVQLPEAPEEPETPAPDPRQEAIDAHHKSEMMTAIAELRKKYHLKMRVERFRDAD